MRSVPLRKIRRLAFAPALPAGMGFAKDGTMTGREIETSDHRIEAQGGTLFARRWQPAGHAPDAPAILLFHDSIGSVELWRGFPQDLVAATGLPTIAYDRIGFGRSDPSRQPLARDFITAEAVTSIPLLRARFRIDRFIAFGHSVGAAMAVATAAALPDACVAVVTEAAQTFAEDRTLAGIRDAKAQFADPDQFARLARYHGDKARWVLDAWTETWLSADFADWTLTPQLQQLRCPLLAIHGDSDEYGSAVHPERILALAGGPTTSVIFENCGHIPHREQPDQVLATVGDFLVSAGAMAAA